MQIRFTGFEQCLLWQEKPCTPSIYWGEEKPPPACQVVRIPLDASARSLLQWEVALTRAENLNKQGLGILWELVISPLEEDEALHLALHLNCEHFTHTVWPRFAEKSWGLLFTQGGIDLLRGLAPALPLESTCWRLLDTASCLTPAHFLTTCHPFYSSPFHLILQGPYPARFPYAFPFLLWGEGEALLGRVGEKGTFLFSRPLPWALLIGEEADLREINELIAQLGETPFRVIHEADLTGEWEGVDHLVVPQSLLTPKVERKLAGFVAAGGRVI